MFITIAIILQTIACFIYAYAAIFIARSTYSFCFLIAFILMTVRRSIAYSLIFMQGEISLLNLSDKAFVPCIVSGFILIGSLSYCLKKSEEKEALKHIKRQISEGCRGK